MRDDAELMGDDAVFGEHELRAKGLGIGRIIGYFPWQSYFDAVGIIGKYPSMLYVDEEAEALFDGVSSDLAAWVVANNPKLDLELLFAENSLGESIGTLDICLKDERHSAEYLPAWGVDVEVALLLLAKATLEWVMLEEAYGEQLQSEIIDSYLNDSADLGCELHFKALIRKY